MHTDTREKMRAHLVQHGLGLFFSFAWKSDPHGSECSQSLTHQLSLLLFTPQVYQWITLHEHKYFFLKSYYSFQLCEAFLLQYSKVKIPNPWVFWGECQR